MPYPAHYHAFSQGRPKERIFQTLSTLDLPPRQRYDYWCASAVRSAEPSPADARTRRDFNATATSLATRAGEMHYVKADAYRVNLTHEGIRAATVDELALFLMVKGQARITYDGEREMKIEQGGFFLLDGLRPTSLDFSDHQLIQLDLPRPLLKSVFAGPIPEPALVNEALANSRLVGLLRGHLQQFPNIAASLAPSEQLALLHASESFGIATIEGAFTSQSVAEEVHEGLFAAAQRYIKRHLSREDLDPASVAAAIGCSRSTLYRLFSERELTVQGHIRELRLQRLLYLLQKESATIPIHLLAQRCGLYDAVNISRMFRRRFGVSPSEAREEQQLAKTSLTRRF